MKKLLIASCIGLSYLTCHAATNTLNNQQTTLLQEQLIEKQDSTALCIPALEVKIIPLINKEVSLPFKEKFVSYSYKIETAETNLTWINQQLLDSLISNLDTKEKDIKTKQELIHFYQRTQNVEQKALQDFLNEMDIGMASDENIYSSTLTFLGQRFNIVSFQRETYEYNIGAAHGLGLVKLLNFDLNKKKLLSLQDIVIPGKQQDIRNLLWQQYNVEVMENNPFIEKASFHISPNFLFNVEGIYFIYQPYEIGPYSMGNIKLKLSWDEAKDFIKKEYLW